MLSKRPFNRDKARENLCRMLVALRKLGPKEAGNHARVEAVLLIEGWPFEEKRYREFCSEVGIPALD